MSNKKWSDLDPLSPVVDSIPKMETCDCVWICACYAGFGVLIRNAAIPDLVIIYS